MKFQRIAIFVAMLLVAGPASAQGPGDAGNRGQDRATQGFEGARDLGQSRGQARPDEARRERRGRAEERIRERRERRGGEAGERGRNGGDDIYRRSNNYRRW